MAFGCDSVPRGVADVGVHMRVGIVERGLPAPLLPALFLGGKQSEFLVDQPRLPDPLLRSYEHRLVRLQ